ncbi:hypothetical protein OY671_000656, partial [Metschnikowia pulcherrima]
MEAAAVVTRRRGPRAPPGHDSPTTRRPSHREARMTLRRTDLPSSELMTLLDAWSPERRWYPVKGVAVRHVPWSSFALDVPATAGQDPARDPRVVLHSSRSLGDGVDLVVQVPLVLEPGDASPAAPGDAHTPGGAAPSA